MKTTAHPITTSELCVSAFYTGSFVSTEFFGDHLRINNILNMLDFFSNFIPLRVFWTAQGMNLLIKSKRSCRRYLKASKSSRSSAVPSHVFVFPRGTSYTKKKLYEFISDMFIGHIHISWQMLHISSYMSHISFWVSHISFIYRISVFGYFISVSYVAYQFLDISYQFLYRFI